jgi:pimeloyl-ACP methyl ester carboxylesterase
MTECVADAVAILDALGLDSVHLVGHDWGAIVGWFLAARHADRVRTLTAASVPHPAAFAEALSRNLDQRLKSSYVALFRQRHIAERLLLAGDAALLRFQCTASGLPASTVDNYIDPLTKPGALTAALAWYRAMSLAEFRTLEQVDCPTTYVWSDRDRAIGRYAAQRCGEHVVGPYRYVQLPRVSHWIADVAPDSLAEAIIDRAMPLTLL